MKLKFNAQLDYQLDAIQALTDLFEGLPVQQGEFEVNMAGDGRLFCDLGVANYLTLQPDQLVKNLHRVQERNDVAKSSNLLEPDSVYKFPNFSIEMETGTGKTYVYLRSIFEMNRRYGFKKFIIVVPSIAIREGVLSSIDLMRDHFRGLYDNVPFESFVYNAKDLSKVRQFAVSNEIQIMIINIQAFQRDTGDINDYNTLTEEQRKKLNIIHQEQDRMAGHRPIEFIQSTSPIVFLDEPQSIDTTPKAKRAICTLNPLLVFRYSATHEKLYNPLYCLDPIKAYDLRLVKQIEVASIDAKDNFNDVYLRIDGIGYAKSAKRPHAKATIHVDGPNGPKAKSITLNQGTDISTKTDRAGYDGFIVTNISAEKGMEHVEFSNGIVLKPQQEQGGLGDAILKLQVRQTVEEHLKKEVRFRDQGIKVLSLFFVDTVAHYRYYNDQGEPQKGKIALWFEEALRELLKETRYKGLLPYPVEALHDGYFSTDKKHGKLKDTSGSTKADDETYQLIMRDKERLLSMDEPLRFIFSHSALKEGWDNPNVFQICSLREMGSERERRQTIGRGLRLPVNQEGERVYDDAVNRLTVIASESFEDYARGLQAEMEQDIGAGFRFGRIPEIGFARVLDPASDRPIGQDASKDLWQTLVKDGYLDAEGDLTDKFRPEDSSFSLALPAKYQNLQPAIMDAMKRYVFTNRVVDARQRKRLAYNKHIELNEDFKVLWEKISKKTRYSVDFETEALIERAGDKIKRMDKIQAVKILIDKTEVKITEAGVDGGQVLESGTKYIQSHQRLPDILAFLQRETELTRQTLVEILKRSGRLAEFAVNPQAFMTEVAKLITRSLSELVIDGIKYEQLDNQVYEMRLFQEKEIEEYLSRLYQVQNDDKRTPYDYVVYDSTVEREIAARLDANANVRFFCKLPRWFVVPTPLGEYNPDWAVVTEDEVKLYLIRETKSTHDQDKRREYENRKIECGKAHFKALGVDFSVATNIHEMLAKR